jgi:cytochrome b6-f complex iron-sulfur subunit
MKFLSAVLALCAYQASAFAPAPAVKNSRSAAVAPSLQAATEELYIDESRRFTMNVIMVGAGLTTVAGFGIPFVLFFFPPGTGGGAGGIPAKDALGNDIIAKDYLASKPAGDRSLAQGLKGDAT